MGLAGLDAALSGLKVSQQQISVISNNIANVGTAGFTRKTMAQKAQSANGVTVGVLSETIVRKVDLSLARDLWTQISGASFYGVQETYLNRVQEFHGPPEKELSVAAKISDLKDAFSALADSPENSSARNQALRAADTVAKKINDFARLLTTMRNDAQTDMQAAVSQVNDLLNTIATTNAQVSGSSNAGRSAAAAEDTRDEAIKKLSELIDISFFKRGDGVVVVQTNQGVLLAGTTANELTFRPTAVSASSVYPATAAGLYVGDPALNPNAIDIADDAPGGKLGGLLALRDETLPKEQAQLDELAHKLATRMDSQGLRLFTNSAGSIPLDTAPNPSTPTPVPYIGFASEIRVNQAIVDDPSLLQQGTATTDLAVQSGSNEVLRRIVEFGFGSVAYQQATGDIDMRSTANGASDLQTWLGIFSRASLNGTRNIAAPNFTDIAGLVSASNGALADPADQFRITFSESRTSLGPTTVTIDLSAAAAAYPIGGAITDGLDQIVAYINNRIAAASTPAALAAVASRGANGQIVLSSRGDIQIDATSFLNSMGATGLANLGLTEGTTETSDPYFDVTVGEGAPQRVYLEPGDDETDLLDKLNYLGGSDTDGVPGLGAAIDASGFLTVRPGDSANPALATFGGDLAMQSGAFTSNGTGGSGVPSGVNLVSALFGSYTAGPPVQNVSPIADVSYGSTISNSNSATVGFRTNYLGPNANISTELDNATSLIDYAQKMVAQQTQDLSSATSGKEDQKALQDILQTEYSSQSGVNLDEELSNLIVYQQAFAASARVINAVDELFQQLMNAL